MTTEKKWIPEISEEKIQELAKKIAPVVRFARGEQELFRDKKGFLYWIEPVDLFNMAYTFDPKPTKEAVGLKPIGDITTYHTYGYQGLFKPSIAEVLAQIPAELLENVVAFEIVKKPETADDLNREQTALNAGYHVATTRLYAQE
jgi:hypothetical protein